MRVSSWGRLGSFPHNLVTMRDEAQATSLLKNNHPGIAYGMGRSYGDVCLNTHGSLWKTTELDHYSAFDQENGVLSCEAGVLLRDIQRLIIPNGWILPVTPGTQLITVGGAIANDIHGKNHHLHGSFGDHVRKLRLLRTDGEIIECGPNLKPDWFAATVGGIGLTGLILDVELSLRPVSGPWMDTETVPYETLDEFFKLSNETEADWEHTVSWIDCISGGGRRGILMRGNPAPANRQERREPKNINLTVPLVPPISLVNRLSLRPFNIAYFHMKKAQAGRKLDHYERFFYPLDNLLEWNRIYGPKGFFQYQSVVPGEGGKEAVSAMLQEISKMGEGSFLAVIKTFGNRRSLGMMGFPRPGITLALDFPNKGERTAKLFARLDRIVQEAGGVLYLAKDARMSREMFEATYDRLPEFLKYRDPGISSDMSRRLMGV